MKYIVNLESKETHIKGQSNERCNLDDANPNNLKVVSALEFVAYIREGFDACAYCFSEDEEESPNALGSA